MIGFETIERLTWAITRVSLYRPSKTVKFHHFDLWAPLQNNTVLAKNCTKECPKNSQMLQEYQGVLLFINTYLN